VQNVADVPTAEASADVPTAEASAAEPTVSESLGADDLPTPPTNTVSAGVSAEAEATLVPA
jgi:hypothetical protein